MASRILLSMLLLHSVCLNVVADYDMSVLFLSYENPSHRCGDPIYCRTIRCCDYNVANCTASGFLACDNYFKFCLRPFGSTYPTGLCYIDYPPITTMQYPEDSDAFDFAIGENGLDTGLPNPYLYALQGTGVHVLDGVQLYVQVIDHDTQSNDDLVDTFTFDVEFSITLENYQLRNYSGQYGLGFLSLNISLTCSQNYYGPDCSRFCIETNDSSGHYSCDNEGNIVCNDGYQDPLLGCVQCVPREGCSTVGGFCQAPGECQCNPDYYGPNCDRFCLERNDSSGHYTCDSEGNTVCNEGYQDPSSNCTACVPSVGCSSVGGYCLLPAQCLCLPDFNGTSCDIDLDPCSHQLPCQNGASCTNVGPDMYQCTCLQGDLGVNCELNQTGNQSPSSSFVGAVAGGVVGGFLGLVVVMVIVVVVMAFCWISSRKKRTSLSDKEGLPAPQPMDNPTYVSTPPLAVSPVCGSTTDDSAGYAYHEFDNPIYGSK